MCVCVCVCESVNVLDLLTRIPGLKMDGWMLTALRASSGAISWPKDLEAEIHQIFGHMLSTNMLSHFLTFPNEIFDV